MTTSGTTTFSPDFVDAIEEAYERCGIDERSGYEMRSARRSINLMFAEWANRGLNMWSYEGRSQLLTQDLGTYTLGTDVVDLIEHMIQLPPGASSQTVRYDLTRVSITTHATRTNPDLTGRPTEIYIDRSRDAPVVHLWPLPGDQGPYTMYYWVLRRLQDAGAYTNTGDFPFRFIPVFIAGLAFYIAEKKQSGNTELIMRLKSRYEEEWERAAGEDRERATLMIVPRPAYRIGG